MFNLIQVSSTFLYFSILPCLFFSIYWGKEGVYAGLLLVGSLCLALMAFTRVQIAKKLRWMAFRYEELPYFQEEVKRFTHWLAAPTPKLWVIKKDSLEAGLFGFSKKTRHLFVTSACLENLPLSEISSLLASLLSEHSFSSTTLLSYQFALLFPFSRLLNKQKKSFWEWTLQFFILSYLFIPLYLLKGRISSKAIDEQALKMFPYPLVYGSVLRRFNFSNRTIPVKGVESLLSIRSQKQEAIPLILEGESSLLERIHWVETKVYG